MENQFEAVLLPVQYRIHGVKRLLLKTEGADTTHIKIKLFYLSAYSVFFFFVREVIEQKRLKMFKGDRTDIQFLKNLNIAKSTYEAKKWSACSIVP